MGYNCIVKTFYLCSRALVIFDKCVWCNNSQFLCAVTLIEFATGPILIQFLWRVIWSATRECVPSASLRNWKILSKAVDAWSGDLPSLNDDLSLFSLGSLSLRTSTIENWIITRLNIFCLSSTFVAFVGLGQLILASVLNNWCRWSEELAKTLATLFVVTGALPELETRTFWRILDERRWLSYVAEKTARTFRINLKSPWALHGLGPGFLADWSNSFTSSRWYDWYGAFAWKRLWWALNFCVVSFLYLVLCVQTLTIETKIEDRWKSERDCFDLPHSGVGTHREAVRRLEVGGEWKRKYSQNKHNVRHMKSCFLWIWTEKARVIILLYIVTAERRKLERGSSWKVNKRKLSC